MNKEKLDALQALGYKTHKLSSEFTLQKSNLDESKLLDVDEQEFVDITLKKQGRLLIHCHLTPAKNDYKHDFDRGTVHYTTKSQNYSFHKVIIPDNTVIDGGNFTQRDPNTDAIAGKYLIFKECTLVNVKIDPSWALISCNTSQIKAVIKGKALSRSYPSTVALTFQKLMPDGKYVDEWSEDVFVNNDDVFDLLTNRLSQEA